MHHIIHHLTSLATTTCSALSRLWSACLRPRVTVRGLPATLLALVASLLRRRVTVRGHYGPRFRVALRGLRASLLSPRVTVRGLLASLLSLRVTVSGHYWPRFFPRLLGTAAFLLLFLPLILAWGSRYTIVADGTTGACTQAVNFTGYARIGSETPLTADNAGVIDTAVNFTSASFRIASETPLTTADTKLLPSRGGTGQDTSAITGIPKILAGVWGSIASSIYGESIITAADYPAMRTQLSLVPGTNVQAYASNLTTWAGITPSANGESMVTAADYPTMRSLLGIAESATKTETGTGSAGQVSYDANYLYICIGTNSWKRIAWSAW